MNKTAGFPLGGILLGAVVAILAVSCEMSSGLLSESERSSLYTLTVAPAGNPALANGAVISPGSELEVSVVKRSGASALAVLDLSLKRPDGSAVSTLRFIATSEDSSKVKPSEAALPKKTPRIEGRLAGFSVPADQPPGAYELSISAIGVEGSVLQQERIAVFVGSSAPVIDSISVYPPAVEPGASVLLGLSLSWARLSAAAESGESSAAEAGDPWIKWSRNGVVFAEGTRSAGFSRAVWTAPRAEGAYSVRAEVYPSAPAKGAGFSFKAAASQDLRVMVIGAAGGSGNDFADALSFFSLLKLDGSFDDSGARPRIEQPESFGAPKLEEYPGGFGYRFGSDAGATLPGLMPPSSSGMLAPFAVLVRLDPEQGGSGYLVRFASADSSNVLSLGLDGGRPYVESRVAGAARRSLAVATVPRGPLTLEAILRPEGDSLTVSWRAEGERIEAPSIPLPAAPRDGGATLGGEGSLAGVYDGFGLMAPGSGSASAYPSPAFRLAARRQWKSSVVIAEGFDDGVMPPQATVSGSAKVTPRGLELMDSGSVALAPLFAPGSGVAVEVGIAGDRGACLVAFLDGDGKRAFAVRGDGEVLSASGARIGSVPVSGPRLGFSIEPREGKPSLIGSGGAIACELPGAAKRYSLSLEHAGGVSPAIVDRVLLRSLAVAPTGR